jgi:hypothetical protein
VAERGGTDAGLVAFDTDPQGALDRVTSPTVLDAGTFVGAFAIGALVFCAVVIVGGRWLLGRAGPSLVTEGAEGNGEPQPDEDADDVDADADELDDDGDDG